MDNNQIVTALFDAVQNNNLDIADADKKFYTKLVLHAAEIRDLYTQLYNDHPDFSANFTKLIEVLISSHLSRPQDLKDRDNKKPENWYLSNELAGMSLMEARFNADFDVLRDNLPFFNDLGINVLHLANIQVDPDDLRAIMHQHGLYLMLDLVQNDTEKSKPAALVNLLKDILFNANIGVDILVINASDFQEVQSQFHTILQLIKQCLQVTAPGMALGVTASASPEDAMKFFGEARYLAKECDFVYNDTQMSLQWDALASGQVAEMIEAETFLYEKPFGTTWINYTISNADKNVTLASLSGLDQAIKDKSEMQISTAIQRILLMQANSFFLGGLPMVSFADQQESMIENRIFSGTKKLLAIRKSLDVVSDTKNTRWLPRHNIHIAGFVRNGREKALYCIFNYSSESAYLTWHSFRYNGLAPEKLYDYWREIYLEPGNDAEFLVLEPYGFYLLEVVA
ncbi:hypothetical protein [Dyadobacter sp. CY347]|uniref:hypothetical protein n=1 Tax=Dyadobacter sp. CY347 TaxID=2909336 RepID=UPI001F25979B|nr:hypothetical protein [Dyadobacter sp. CY347]MCF2491210.1 hypothetical protein [Dyadobacter sp. CY347]